MKIVILIKNCVNYRVFYSQRTLFITIWNTKGIRSCP